jgi:DNA replicative helicase MCM subunit Mcm2 (Cdc46/Mcm family)
MGEVIRFLPKSERERVRLIREARARYDTIFPSADRPSEQNDREQANHMTGGEKAASGDEAIPS